jgi:hypothetical protein
MIEKTFPSVPISLQVGLRGAAGRKGSDPVGAESELESFLFSVIVDPFCEQVENPRAFGGPQRVPGGLEKCEGSGQGIAPNHLGLPQ